MELLRSEELSTSGSMRDGISASQEKEFRDEGLVLIKDLAIKVRLPQPVVATAQVYFHRFSLRNSFRQFKSRQMAAVCLFLASKACEKPRHIEVICRHFYELEMERLRRGNPNLQTPPLSNLMLQNLKQTFLGLEFRLLNDLRFEVAVPLPYQYITEFQRKIRDWEPKAREDYLRVANNFCNDSFRTQVCLIKSAENIAHACLHLAAEYFRLRIDIPHDKETVFRIAELYKKCITQL